MKYRRFIYPALFCIYVAAVLFLCFTNGEQLPDVPPVWFGIPADKAAHFIMFCPFVPLSYLAFVPRRTTVWRKFALLAVCAATGAGLAASTEYIQGLLGYRTEDILDMLSDSFGLAAGAVLTAAAVTYEILRKK